MAENGTQRCARGFTLVEILVAFAIMALTFAVVMQAFSGGLRILSVSQARAGAMRVAENRLAEAGRAVPLAPGMESGTEGRYQWRLNIAPYSEDSGETASIPPAYAVTVTVGWGRGRSLTLSTIELGPPANE